MSSFFGQNNNNQPQQSGFGGFGANNNNTASGMSAMFNSQLVTASRTVRGG